MRHAGLIILALLATTATAAANERLGSRRITASVEFAAESMQLSRQALAELDATAARLLGDPRIHVVIEGHCDSSGNSLLNDQLSEGRAQMVKVYLVAKGVAAGRISVVNRGDDAPRASNDTVEGRARNRRVDLRLGLDSRSARRVKLD